MDTRRTARLLHQTASRSRRIADALEGLQEFLLDVVEPPVVVSTPDGGIQLPPCRCVPAYRLADSIAQHCPVHGQEAPAAD